MSKDTGIGARFFIGGYDISGDVGSAQTIATRRALLDVTDITQSAFARLGGLGDGEISFNSWWDTDTDLAHDALSALPSTDRIAMYFHRATLGADVACLTGKQVNYDPNRTQDGALAATVQVLASAGSPLEWGFAVTTGKQTFASGANGTSVDGAAASTSGASAYLEVFSLGSGTVEIAIEDSANDTDFAAVTGLGFTDATGRTAERVETASGADLRRYVRVAVSGTFTDAVIAVAVCRYADPA